MSRDARPPTFLSRVSGMSGATADVDVDARFSRLLEAYGRFLRDAIAKICPRQLGLEVAEIEQQARLRLWHALRRETDLSDPASYIYKVAVSTTIDAVRRVVARREQPLDLDVDDARLPSVPAHELPDRLVERRLLMEQIRLALSRVAEPRRAAVELYLEGMGSREIADLMNWTEPKARNLTYRGLEDLRNELRALGIGYEKE